MKQALLLLAALSLTACNNNPCTNESKIEGFAKDQVLKRLKSPSSAKFSDLATVPYDEGGGLVVGNVDSQNGFGAMIRNDFQFTLECKDGSLSVKNASLGDEHWGSDKDRLAPLMEQLKNATNVRQQDSITTLIREETKKMYPLK